VKNEIVKNERPRDILQTCSFEEEKDPTDVTSPKSSDPELQYKTMVYKVQYKSCFTIIPNIQTVGDFCGRWTSCKLEEVTTFV
jgi:hypothetical protein